MNKATIVFLSLTLWAIGIQCEADEIDSISRQECPNELNVLKEAISRGTETEIILARKEVLKARLLTVYNRDTVKRLPINAPLVPDKTYLDFLIEFGPTRKSLISLQRNLGALTYQELVESMDECVVNPSDSFFSHLVDLWDIAWNKGRLEGRKRIHYGIMDCLKAHKAFGHLDTLIDFEERYKEQYPKKTADKEFNEEKLIRHTDRCVESRIPSVIPSIIISILHPFIDIRNRIAIAKCGACFYGSPVGTWKWRHNLWINGGYKAMLEQKYTEKYSQPLYD